MFSLSINFAFKICCTNTSTTIKQQRLNYRATIIMFFYYIVLLHLQRGVALCFCVCKSSRGKCSNITVDIWTPTCFSAANMATYEVLLIQIGWPSIDLLVQLKKKILTMKDFLQSSFMFSFVFHNSCFHFCLLGLDFCLISSLCCKVSFTLKSYKLT